MTTSGTTKKTRSTRNSAGSGAGAVLPLFVSLSLHAVLLFVLLGVTLSVQTTTQPPPPPPDSAVLLPAFRDPAIDETESPRPPPLAPPDAALEPPDAEDLTRVLETPPTAGAVAEVEPARNDDLLRRLDSVERAASASLRANRGGVFAGARAARGRRVVYAVDGSGAMVSCLGFVLDELIRSVSKLSEGQEVAVVLFRTPPGSREPELIWPLGDAPVATGPDVTRRLRNWSDTINASGRSAPIAGLAAAARVDPDVIFFLSRGVERTAGEPWAGGPAVALAALEDALGEDALARPAIKPVQFIDQDPTGVMAAIARAHDPDALNLPERPYLLLTLDELREPPDDRDAPDAGPDPTPPQLRTAGRELATLSSTGVDTRVRFGPRPEKVTAEVRGAVARARRALAALPDSAEPDPRLPIAIARTELLAHHAGLTGDLDEARSALEAFEPDRRDTAWYAFEFSRRALLALLPTESPSSEHESAARALLATHGRDPLIDPALALELILLPLEQQPPNDAQQRVAEAMRNPPFTVGDRHDTFAFVMAARAIATAFVRAGDTMGAVYTLASAVDDPRLGPTGDRRAILYPELSRLIDDAMVRDTIPTHGLMAEAEQAEADPARRLAAVTLYDLVAERETKLESEAQRRAALLTARLSESGVTEPPDAGRRLFDVWRETDDARSPAIAAAALGFLRDTPDYLRALRIIVPEELDLDDRDGWRLELARAEFEAGRPVPAMDTLDLIEPHAKRAPQAAALGAWGAAKTLEAGPDMPLAERALAQQRRYGGEHAGVFELVIARAVEVTDPDRAAELYLGLLESDKSPATRSTLRLGLARARMNADRDEAAIDALRPLLSRRAPSDTDPDAFWEAWAIAIETMNRAELDPSAHLLRLRSIDPEFGGAPWRDRLEAAAERLPESPATLAP